MDWGHRGVKDVAGKEETYYPLLNLLLVRIRMFVLLWLSSLAEGKEKKKMYVCMYM